MRCRRVRRSLTCAALVLAPASAFALVNAEAASAGSPATACNPVPLVGCSNSDIALSSTPGFLIGDGWASQYYPSYNGPLWIQYILYGPGFTVLADGTAEECGQASACGTGAVYVDNVGSGTYAMQTWTWEPYSNNQPSAWATVNVK